MTNTIADVEKADTIIVIGSNTTENHPVLSSFVKRAALKGTTLIVIDPRKITLTKHANKWLRQDPGSDIALINALMHVIIKEDLHDKNFISERTENFDEFSKVIEKYTPEYASKITNIKAEDIVETARLYANAKKGAILYCMGITQHTTGTDNVKSLANLAMLCGNLGIEGGGVNPLRGQNNVQGACDMGGLPNVFTAYQKVDDDSARAIYEQKWRTTELPSKPGIPVTEMINMAARGEFKSLYIIGENPLVSDPDLNHAEKAFKNLDFLVVQDIFLTETAQIADVVLPAYCFAEKNGTFSNTERRVQRVRKVVEAPGQTKPDWKILCDVASRMGYEMNYENSEAIFTELAQVTPSYRGIDWNRIEKVGIHWPCPDPNHPGTPILHTKAFTRGKGLFHSIDHAPPKEMPDKEYPFVLTTGRLLYHYHTGTMTMKSEGLNTLSKECFVEISKNDAEKLNCKDGTQVHIASRRGEITANLKISSKAFDGTVFIPFHFSKAAANRLTNAELDPTAKIPEFKVCAVKIYS
jgi:formate dehydrogenase alpha subunit